MPLSRYSEQRAYLPASLSGIRPESLPASRHRTGHSSGLHPEDSPYLTMESTPHSERAMGTPLMHPPQQALRLPAPMDVPTPGDDAPTEVGITRSNRARSSKAFPRTIPSPQVVPIASPQVYTIGYSQPGARVAIDTLVWHEGWVIIDIRRVAVSTWTDWTERSLLQRYGSAYVPVPELGNLDYRHHRLPIVLADAPTGLQQVLSILQKGRRSLLLCGCKDYRTCHRDIVARLLQREGVAVTHLVTQSLPPERVRLGQAAGNGIALSLLLTGQQVQLAATGGLLTLTRTQSITLPVAGRRQSLSVQVSLTAWPSTVVRRLPTSPQGGFQ